MKEIWKDIAEYPTYQISSLARVRRIDRDAKPSAFKRGRKTTISGFILNQRLRAGYLSVSLRKNGKNVDCVVHRLIAIAFLPNPKNLKYVNHINGVKTDNKINNLEWCTMQQNTVHAYDHGLAKSGEYHVRAKLTSKDVIEIRKQYADGASPTVLGKKYGVRDTCIGNIVKRRTWKRV